MARNSRDGRKKSADAFCCVTTRRSTPPAYPSRPRRRPRLPMASGPPMPAVFAAGVPPRRVAGAPQVEIASSAAVSPPASVALPQDIPAPGSTAGYTVVPETSGRIPSANSFATPAVCRKMPMSHGSADSLGSARGGVAFSPGTPLSAHDSAHRGYTATSPASMAYSAERHLPTEQPRPSAHYQDGRRRRRKQGRRLLRYAQP